MSVETIDGYHLVNIKVDPLYRNPFLLLLTASLVAINSSIDYASYLLRKFQDYSYNLIRVLAQLARRRRVRDGGGRERQIVLPSRVPPRAVVDQVSRIQEIQKRFRQALTDMYRVISFQNLKKQMPRLLFHELMVKKGSPSHCFLTMRLDKRAMIHVWSILLYLMMPIYSDRSA